jgi:hypothetical protein
MYLRINKEEIKDRKRITVNSDVVINRKDLLKYTKASLMTLKGDS